MSAMEWSGVNPNRTKIDTLGPVEKRAARAALAAGTPEDAVMDLVAEILRLGRQVTATQADRERAVEAALDRANDCADHGRLLTRQAEQIDYWEREAHQAEAFRGILCGLLQGLDEDLPVMRRRVVDGEITAEEVLDMLLRASAKAQWEYNRIWSSKPKAAKTAKDLAKPKAGALEPEQLELIPAGDAGETVRRDAPAQKDGDGAPVDAPLDGDRLAQAEARGYAKAIAMLRADELFANWWSSGTTDFGSRYWEAGPRNHLADFLETIAKPLPGSDK